MKSFKTILNEVSSSKGLHEISGDELIRLQKLLLSAYLDVVAVCEKHHLQPMLIGGTALGAVRHHGFIPWDDDFDFAITRKDYEVFKQIFEQELGDKYVLDAPNYCQNASNRFPMIRVKGTRFVQIELEQDDPMAMIKIDLFIIENIPESKLYRLVKGSWCSLLMGIASYVQFYEKRNAPLRDYMYRTKDGRRQFNFRSRIGRLFSIRSSAWWLGRVDRACQYAKETSLMGIPSGRGHYFGEICERSVFLPVTYGLFEKVKLALPANADYYLENLYGDYMHIPPAQERQFHKIIELKF